MVCKRAAVLLACALGLASAQYNISCGTVNGTVFQFSGKDINATEIHFSDYKGQVLMFANVASF